MTGNGSGAARLSFPRGFLWGCATSPTQVEGETVNEWAGFVARDGRTPEDGPAHWRRYREDFARLSEMNLGAYRLGLDWGRLQGGPMKPLERGAVRHYQEMLSELRRRGVEPFITLFHFACPRWLAERGGWTCRDAPRLFADFAGRAAEVAEGEIRFWITVNEPLVYCLMAYVLREFVPCRRWRWDLAIRALDNLRRGHVLAREAIKSRQPSAQVGIAKHFKHFSPFRPWHPVDNLSASMARDIFHRWGVVNFTRAGNRLVSDFVGVNYYGRMRMKGFNGVSPVTGFDVAFLKEHGLLCDDMWEQDPSHLCDCLEEAARETGLPIYVTENGVATRHEEVRRRYLMEHLASCHAAVRRGVDLRGFFYWSLMDNFEWAMGLTKLYGLVAVDFGHLQRPRVLRSTGRLYGQIAAQNALPAPGTE